MPAPARAFPQRAVIEHWVPGNQVDAYGNPVLELGSTEAVPCNLQPKGTTEDTANQDQQTASWNLYLPAGTELGGSDRVVVDGGVTMEAIGAGRPWAPFGGRPHHVEATLRAVQ
jgi:hypothetical protein